MNLTKLLRAFHERITHPAPPGPQRLTPHIANIRRNLVIEECAELQEALRSFDPIQIAHEAADMIIVAGGSAVAAGVDIDEIVEAVMVSNMGKRAAPDGGKAIKPPGWVPADVAGIVYQQMRRAVR